MIEIKDETEKVILVGVALSDQDMYSLSALDTCFSVITACLLRH